MIIPNDEPERAISLLFALSIHRHAVENSHPLYRIATTSRYLESPVREHAVPVCFRAASKEAAHSQPEEICPHEEDS
jgi:hypothetical protein